MTTKYILPEGIRLEEKNKDSLTPEMEMLKARLKATWMAGNTAILRNIWNQAL